MPPIHAQEPTRVPRGSPNDPARAERRRKSLRDFLAQNDLNPMTISRQAGLSTPNAIYNFLNGRTSQLSQETLEKMAAVVPGTTVDILMGNRVVKGPSIKDILIRAEAQAGVMRDSFDLPLAWQKEISMPISPQDRAAGAYAMTVRSPGMDLVWPDGTVVVCLPINRSTQPITTGRKLVLQRQNKDRVEVTIRDLVVKNGVAHLWLRTSDPRHQVPVQMPWPQAGQPWKQGEDIYTVLAIVTLACVPQD